jgi:hypothetical protein
MRKRTLAVSAALATVVLVGCGLSGTPEPAPEPLVPISLSDEDKSAVDRDLRSALKDPESAKIGDLRAGRDPKGAITVCGSVKTMSRSW